MLGFTTFSGAPFSAIGGGSPVYFSINFVGEAIVNAEGNAIWNGGFGIIGESFVNVFGEIAGSGWARINPNTPEWDMDKSKDWNKIK